MSRTILNPEYANDLNGLFDGSSAIDAGSINSNTTITAEGNITTAANMECVSLSAGGNVAADGYITAGSTITADGDISAGGNVAADANVSCVSVIATGNVTASTGNVSCVSVLAGGNVAADGYITAGSYITATGTITGASFAGGIASLFVSSVSVAEIFAGTSIPYTYVIPNFVGNGTTTAYTISSNLQTGVAPGSQTTYFIWSVSFNSTDGQDTTVNVLVSNPSANTIGASTYNISIMAMN